MFNTSAEDLQLMAQKDQQMLKQQLREGGESSHSECRVYKAKKDGTMGRFLRIERPEPIQYHFTSGRRPE
ncbi:hypothetical protein LCGC14_0861910 [marine sediment metagenome]|uniref:Uncharacterized protein n=1 Tax=marine sediment metagenome TaxID=412755 RepID=A0A0F9P746_9ZZZZ